jgi:KaiC/GvpD/RAD55 family RecA-like ATPase
LNYLPERDLVKLLLSKEKYLLYFPYIDKTYLKDNYRELYNLYVALEEAHSRVEGDLTLDSFKAFFFHRYPDADKGLYLELFKLLSESELDEGLGLTLLKDIRARKQGIALAELSYKFSIGNATREEIDKAYTALGEAEETKEEFEFVTTNIDEIVADVFKKPGLRWRLDALNKSLGSLRKGNFGFLFARPECGKTTFLASEISNMLAQLKEEDGSVIWFNNEQVGAEVMLRVYQGFFGVRLEQIKANPAHFKSEFQRLTKGKFLLVDNANIEKGFVERICRKYNPSLVIFDQIDKIKGFNADREDLRLGSIYIWARELAKEYCPVIGICQADGTAEGQKWLTMEHVANAKTSKQAEADWILGMGSIHSEGMQYIRYLNISKNKLLGDDDTLSKLRHGKFEVLIEPEVARFRDIIKYE